MKYDLFNSIDTIGKECSGKVTLIGMCGRSGSGKTYVADMFAEYGITSLDLDRVYGELTSAPGDNDCMRELAAEFGQRAVSPDGSLNRPYVASVVFGDKTGSKLSALNRITHRHILARTEEICRKLSDEGKNIIILDAPALFESGADKKCAYTFCVVADEKKRLERICRRDGISEEKAKLRLDSQLTDGCLIDRCDFVVPNYGRDDDTRRAVLHIVNTVKTELGV